MADMAASGSVMVTDARYDGKPLLKLLELYVLRALYGGAGQWHEAIAAAVHMPSTMPAAIRDMWEKNRVIARANNVTLTPQKFAEMFVDENSRIDAETTAS